MTVVEAAALFLTPEERDAVLGDLQEAGQKGVRAATAVLGLAARRQAAEWRDWRPWMALGAAIVSGMMLCARAGRVADGSAIRLWLYFNNWNWEQLRTAAARREVLAQLGAVAWQWIALAGLAIAVGFVLRRTSGGGAALIALIFGLLVFLAPAAATRGRSFGPNAAVFESIFYRIALPLLVKLALVMFPAIFGMRLAAGRRQEGRT